MEQRARSIVTAVVDLAAFTSARLSEDEAAAAAASDGPWDAWRGRPGLGLRQLEHGVALPGQEAGSLASIATASWMDAEHIARHDPARALREVAAKRAILARHAPMGGVLNLCEQCVGDRSSERWPCEDVRAIAATWSDHPGYRAEWAPGHG